MNQLIKNAVKQFYQGQDKEVVTMLCDEAQLPNVQSAVAQITGNAETSAAGLSRIVLDDQLRGADANPAGANA